MQFFPIHLINYSQGIEYNLTLPQELNNLHHFRFAWLQVLRYFGTGKSAPLLQGCFFRTNRGRINSG